MHLGVFYLLFKYLLKTQRFREYLSIVGYAVLIQVFFSCSSKPFYDDFECKVSASNSLRMWVSCSTEDSADVYVEYWNEGNSKHFFSKLSKKSLQHKFELINFLPEKKYLLKLHGRIGEKVVESDVGVYRTGNLPDNLPSFDVLKSQLKFDGYILLKTFLDSGAYILIDDKAQIVWYESYDSIQKRPFEWDCDGHITSLKDKHTILEFDLFSNIFNQLDITSGGEEMIAHHELLRNQDGDYVFLTKKTKRFDLRSYGGIKNDSIVGEGIIVMSPKGQIKWSWEIFDVVDPLEYDDFFKVRNDWGHANSIAYSKDGNFLVSFRDFNQVWKIDSKSGKVIWRFGYGGDFKIKKEDVFLRQHAVHINRYGDLMLFDNGDTKRGYTAVKSFSINEGNKSYVMHINVKLAKDIFTSRMGSAYMIDDAYILVCSPMKKVIVAIYDVKGSELWKTRGSVASYRAIYIDANEIEISKPF